MWYKDAAPDRRLFKRQMQADTRGGAMIRARKAAGMSRKQLAEKAGICDACLGKWERDETVPSLTGAELAADALGISLDEYVDHGMAHGEWLTFSGVVPDANDPRVTCSACGKAEAAFAHWKYCPNCGARMDGRC